MLDIIITIVSIVGAILGIGVAIWSFFDTKRKYSYEQFAEERKKKREDADKRFKERSRVGK